MQHRIIRFHSKITRIHGIERFLLIFFGACTLGFAVVLSALSYIINEIKKNLAAAENETERIDAEDDLNDIRFAVIFLISLTVLSLAAVFIWKFPLLESVAAMLVCRIFIAAITTDQGLFTYNGILTGWGEFPKVLLTIIVLAVCNFATLQVLKYVLQFSF